MRSKANLASLTIEKLSEVYENQKTDLEYSNPLELLIAIILSAQCTDKRVNIVTKTLFKELKTLDDYISVTVERLEKLIFQTRFL